MKNPFIISTISWRLFDQFSVKSSIRLGDLARNQKESQQTITKYLKKWDWIFENITNGKITSNSKYRIRDDIDPERLEQLYQNSQEFMSRMRYKPVPPEIDVPL